MRSINRINLEILAHKVRLTGINGESIGIFTLKKALEKAEEAGVDLVEISPNAEPPVCKIMDYGKFIYEKNKSNKEQKKKQKIIQVKEIKFRPSIDESDYKVKLRNLIRFLEDGDKVKITLRFRGREISHQKIGLEVINRVRDDLSDIALVESLPSKIEGRQITMVLAPKKNNKLN
ncbi:Translation initiation factor 3 [Candidatus Palibaumannia cicadellinicola]|uniref:Translation initiation factor IF-3 n=1 Tax=Candidatus Palibaumannia cicadellinicola TaxID=186490 RepID=A0A0K2BLD6_9GAMM|nr:Translation initiation factor 3 [Candidatus Baumannia cicadellinicola]